MFPSSIFVLCQVQDKGNILSLLTFHHRRRTLHISWPLCIPDLVPANVYTLISLILFYLQLSQCYCHDIHIFVFPSQAFCDKETESPCTKGKRPDWEITDRNLVLVLPYVIWDKSLHRLEPQYPIGNRKNQIYFIVSRDNT